MGREACEIENCIQEKNKRNGDANIKHSRRILSLVLALIMVCSTMGMMAFAQVRADKIDCSCGICKPYCQWNEFLSQGFSTYSNRVVECPTHLTHDAEEFYVYELLKCTKCNHITYVLRNVYYQCIRD